CLGEGQEIDWIGHTEYSETRIEQLDHIFNLIGIINPMMWPFAFVFQMALAQKKPAIIAGFALGIEDAES
ncbi:hypothetical protein U1710_20860, partial [Aeromonas caviae]|uniref:hypothetical protein n=1 Tax=Aeromonas caviae TaxID=648 RepID=UPI0030148346